MQESIQIRALLWQDANILYTDFPRLLEAYLRQNPVTQEAEKLGLELRESDPMEWENVEKFIRKVGEWAGKTGPRVLSGKVLKGDSGDILNRIPAAVAHLKLARPDPMAALKEIDKIKGLDVSFASKILRLLFPEYCPVLDSILSCRLDYPLTSDGYGRFTLRCTEIAGELNRTQIASTFPGRKDWRPADVEAALFSWISPAWRGTQ